MSVEVFDARNCHLGEGALWHPERHQFFWFDIMDRKLLTVENGTRREWDFDEHVSAAGWIDASTLLIASEIGFYRFDIETAEKSLVVGLEQDNPATRSNDGRTDPWGGFWIGTMGKEQEREAGAIYRFYEGKIERLFDRISIPNSICFSPDRQFAYFTDTVVQQIFRQPLNAEGWPQGEHEVFVDLRAEGLNPDGSIVDAEGALWNAQWGASRVARYSFDGVFLEAIAVPAPNVTCPCFGGEGMNTLFVTSAYEGLAEQGKTDGQTFAVSTQIKGLPEYQVRLG